MMNTRLFSRFAIFLVAGLLVTGAALAQQNCPTGYPKSTPNSDFADAGNGTVRHIPTGLIWKRCTEGQTWNGATCTGLAAEYNWSQAFLRVDAVNSGADGTQNAGVSDWRLPNLKELRSIYERACYDPSINLSQFPTSPSSDFWSSSPVAGAAFTFEAQSVNFGPVGFQMVGPDTSYGGTSQPGALAVRLVRGGKSYADFEVVPPAIQPQDGLWAIDDEKNGQNGRGFQVETRNGVTVVTYFGYLADGHDHWYLATGPLINGSVTAELTQYRDGTALGAPYAPATANGSAGTVTVSFLSTTTGSIASTQEIARSISKFEFSGSGSPTVVPSNGLWVIDAESNGQNGRGFQIEQYGGLLVLTYYGYDSTGQETWYLAVDAMSGSTFTGALTEYGGGTVMGGNYAPATSTGSPGQVTLSFSSPTTGTITLPWESAKAISKFAW